MAEIAVTNGFTGQALTPVPCRDGGGSIACYPLFEGVTAMLIRLETHGFQEQRQQHDGLEINFCVNGRFESVFSSREQVTMTPGDLAVNRFDGLHGAVSESIFPLGYYQGVCLHVDCAAASCWMRQNVGPLATDFEKLQQNLLGDRWFVAESAGPRCEHVFRELFENLPYFDQNYLRLKALEIFMLLCEIPRLEANQGYCSPEHLQLIRHLRDHLLTDRSHYESLAQLAQEHCLSVSHMQKLFRQVYGVPIYHYIKEYRLEQAAVELSQSRRRITDIAMNAGYDSASKFSQAFKKRYGVTPSAYRREAAQVTKRHIFTKTE